MSYNFDGAGVQINGDSNALSNVTIRNNNGSGVAVLSGTGNSIRTSAIFDNGGLGIDLGGDGVTANDVDDSDVGANDLQNYPSLGVVTAENGHIEGNLTSTPDTKFTIDFFASPTCDITGFGEGMTYVGSTTVTTDNLGSVDFNEFVGVNLINVGEAVTATATAPDGSTSEFSECFFAVTTDIERDEDAEIPNEYELFQNYPNPFNPVTTIRFAISNREWVNVEVYNILGKRVATLVDGYVEAGEFNVEFNASELPSGIYIYRMTAGSFSMSKQLTLLK
ncbi:MAG: T9SS type A sorting domain-containing protein [Bacteroidetes bacterium]|nr:T9SS type A sorting domain-containing protein [Bacteroidota bacterium]